jgi:hypothetical protein
MNWSKNASFADRLAAERHAAAELRAGHADDVAQHPEERGIAVDIDGVIGSIDLDRKGHGYFPVGYRRCSGWRRGRAIE